MKTNYKTAIQKGKYGLAVWKTGRRMFFLWKMRPWRKKRRKPHSGQKKGWLRAVKGNMQKTGISAAKEIKWMGRLYAAVKKQYF